MIGDNSEANFDYNSQGVCGARSDRRALWYEINGIGKEATINVCTNNEKKTDFGIFRACNTQNCLGAPPQQIDAADCDAGESNEYIFLAEEGESYYIHVRSDVLFEGEGSNVSSTTLVIPYLTLSAFRHRLLCAIDHSLTHSKLNLHFFLASLNTSLRYGTQNPQTNLLRHR